MTARGLQRTLQEAGVSVGAQELDVLMAKYGATTGKSQRAFNYGDFMKKVRRHHHH